MNRLLAYGLTCVLLMVAAGAVSATTIVMPADEQLIEKAPLILTGTVVTTGAVEADGKIWTETAIQVGSVLKGSAAQTITVRELGGELEDRVTVLHGTPEFQRNERVLLFLEPNPRGGYRTVDLFVGKLHEARRLDGRRLWIRDDAATDVTLLDANLQPISARNVQRDGVAFESFVRERVAGREGVKNYGVENPVLQRAAGSGGLQENFTLLSPPRIYRWYAFDNNTSARWYSAGTQPGYSDGGVAETRTGMQAWTSFTQAKILYTYSGTRSGSMGGVNSSNGVNEVLFNDPLNEITGTYNRNTGGVVGLGGFNGVATGGMWNAPFAADPSHPAGSQRAYEITEANLTIQDGVSATAGISSNRLAEIIAHEFGHTLGFGHSSDASALMYATLTGLGPSLKTDDQLAARWLYPSGTGGTPGPAPTPTIPAAPSGLAAVPSGTNVSLSWKDNATNESGQSIYIAIGSGAFTKVGDVATNANGATLTGFTPGAYRFYVVAFNGAGTSPQSNIATASIAGPQLTARFSFSPQSGTAGVTKFTFYDESTGGVSTRLWNFGDGTTSTAAVANKIYASAGRFTVTLTVNGGGSSAQTSNFITVNSPLTANFAWSPSSPTTNDTLTFTDQSTGGVTGWLWAFGDGTTSTQPNPSKRYTVAGTYPVTLTINRNGETTAITKQVAIAATAPIVPPVQAAFDVSAISVVAGTTVQFADRSSGAPVSWAWTFGDGGTSAAQNPVHAWALPGTYTVTLIASNSKAAGTISKSVTVTALEPYRSLVSAAAHTAGLGGTAWRTELILFNAGAQGANVSLLFIPGAGGAMITRSLFLSPRQSLTYANTLVDLFGVSNGAGAVAIEATSAGASAQLRITSRTFTGASTGTYGLSVPDVQSDALAQTLYLTGIQSNGGYRTNVGLVNRGGADVPATLTLYDRNGGTVSTANVTVPANNFQQVPLSTFFPEVEGREFDVLSMRVSTASQNAVTAYASVVDNITQDPVYMQALPSAASATQLTLPVVGRANGANGTFWRSDVTVFNPSTSRVTFTLRYNGIDKSLSLNGRSTTVLADVLTQMGFNSGTGTLVITWNSGGAPVVTSRTYTTASGANGGSYGQSIDPVPAFLREMYVPGLRVDASYRSNVGFVNGGSETEHFTVTVLSQSGNELASTVMDLDPNEQIQHLVTVLFPDIHLSGNFTLYVRGDANAKLFAYGSMMDNASGDPVFFAGR